LKSIFEYALTGRDHAVCDGLRGGVDEEEVISEGNTVPSFHRFDGVRNIRIEHDIRQSRAPAKSGKLGGGIEPRGFLVVFEDERTAGVRRREYNDK